VVNQIIPRPPMIASVMPIHTPAASSTNISDEQHARSRRTSLTTSRLRAGAIASGALRAHTSSVKSPRAWRSSIAIS
jgi:hypothetical protein